MPIRKPAFKSGKYRNLFAEYGYSQQDIDEKLEKAWNTLFYGADDEKIYYETGDGLAYILDTHNADARTEGMSYGMMMCVQMDKKMEFDRIWRWAYRYMRHDSGRYRGYFAWSANPDGTKRAQGPAPDGEEYFAMALFFASHRWGDGQPPLDYSTQAKEILRECLHKGENSEGHPMWNPDNRLIKFIPELEFSDPSYHLPHFYDLFSLWADQNDSTFWHEAANASRAYILKACHHVTGLAPEYAHYDGSPETNHGHFSFFSDSYRVAGNIGLDFEWFGGTGGEQAVARNIQAFFAAESPSFKDYANYETSGRRLDEPAMHPYGLLAMNAMASLASGGPYVQKYIHDFWELPLRKGEYRYYDECLQFFSLLALSGRYRIW